MIEPIDVLVSFLMISGQWNIAQRRAAGWWLFLATNAILIGIAWQTARWGLIPGYLILSAINVYGLAKWHGRTDSLCYLKRLVALWISRRITWPTLVYALKERPYAVCGRGGSFALVDILMGN